MITIEIARKAMMGAQILSNGELLASYGGRIPDDSLAALKLVQAHFDEFKHLVLDYLAKRPLFSEYFGPLLKIRLRQQGCLASPLVGVVLDEFNPIEKRLQRIRENNVSGLRSLKKEYRHISRDPNQGEETDKVARDLLSEILVLDFLVQLGFSELERPFSKSQPHVDILAKKGDQLYGIEITRKKEINDWKTLQFGGLEDCHNQDNLDRMRKVLRRTLKKKNNQFSRAIAAGTITLDRVKVVSIKTSDYGFAECVEQAEEIAKSLLATGEYSFVDCIWLIPDVEPSNSRWVYR